MKDCNCEYGKTVPAGFRKDMKPTCPMTAAIPSLTVDSVEGLKGLADVLVHVSNINTTFYIDDKHRIILTWAGPVEADDYDYESNPLNLRSQIVYDFNNNRAIYYNKVGLYRIITLSEEV